MVRFGEPVLSDVCRWLPGKSGAAGQGTWLPAWRHMLDTALVMQQLYHRWLPEAERRCLQEKMSEDEAEQAVVLAALLHDLGKLTPVFAAKLAALPDMAEVFSYLASRGLPVQPYGTMIDPGRSPHALLGAAWLRSQGCPYSLAAVIAAHHGKPASGEQTDLMSSDPYLYPEHLYGSQGRDSREAPLWEEARREWLQYALACCGYASLVEAPELSKSAQMIVSGLLVMADWIASNQEYFPLLEPGEGPVLAVEAERAECAMAELALPMPLECSAPPMDDGEFCARFGFSPHARG